MMYFVPFFFKFNKLNAITDALEWIADAIDTMLEFFKNVGNLISNFTKGLLTFISNIPFVMTMLSSSIANLPSVVVTFATLSITIAVVLLIIGRENNS